MSIKKPYVTAEITRIEHPYETLISLKIPIKKPSKYANDYIRLTKIFDICDYVKKMNKRVGDKIRIYLYERHSISLLEQNQKKFQLLQLPKSLKFDTELLGVVKSIDRKINKIIVDIGFPIEIEVINTEILKDVKKGSLVKFVYIGFRCDGKHTAKYYEGVRKIRKEAAVLREKIIG